MPVQRSLPPPDPELMRRLGVTQPLSNDLAAGIEINIEELRSAVSAIPPSAISSELEWMRFARGLAHTASIHGSQADELWDVLDTASRAAPGYDRPDNWARWQRYINEAHRRDAPTTIASVFEMAKQNGWQGWIPSSVTLTGNPSPVRLVQPNSGSLKVSFSGIAHRPWVYGIDLVRGEITVLAAPGGLGKSSLAIGMAVSLATGQPLLEERIYGGQAATLYINAEDSRDEMRRRIWAFCLRHSIAEGDLQKLLLLGSDNRQTQKLSFLRLDKGNSVLDEQGFATLEALLDEHRPGVLILDPLVAMCGGGNVNDNAAMSLVMRDLKRLANDFHCAVLVLHHTRKGSDLSTAEAIGGASAIVNLARRALMALPMTPEEAHKLNVYPSERWTYFRLAAAKANLVPRSVDAPWYKLCSVTLPNPEPPIFPNGDRVQAVVRAPFSATPQQDPDEQKIRRAILDLVARGKEVGGEFVPYSPARTGAKNERALLSDAINVVREATAPRSWAEGDLEAAVTRNVDALKADGQLVETKIESGRFRRSLGLRVEWGRIRSTAEHVSDPAGT